MVDHVVLLDAFEEFLFECVMVHRVVHHVVAQITQYKSWPERKQPLIGKYQPKQKVKQQRKWNAHRRRHHQAHAVARIIVVHAMENKVHSFLKRAVRREVEHKSVHDVFGQRPHEQAQYKIQDKRADTYIFHRKITVNTIHRRWDENVQRHGKMYFGQGFQHAGLKHSRGVRRVRNIILWHYYKTFIKIKYGRLLSIIQYG